MARSSASARATIAAQFDTGDERYSWLTHSLFVGDGRLTGDHRIEYTIHRLD